jgi:pimeloyl-ACP methyl ester carboxylesterase
MNFTTPDGVRLHWDELGSGAAVVMIHGAATSSRTYDGLVSRLAADFRCIRLDLRGLGRSERVEAVSPTAWCDDVVSLMDHIGLEQVHLLGCSLGARIAGRVALEVPDRARSLTVDAPLVAVESAADGRLNTRFSDPAQASTYDITRWRMFHGDDWQDAVRFYFRARNEPALQEYLTLRPHLSELRLPTLVTRGDIDDDVHPLAHAIEWHAANPSSWLWIAAGCAFSAAQNRPADFAAVFASFVRSCVKE